MCIRDRRCGLFTRIPHARANGLSSGFSKLTKTIGNISPQAETYLFLSSYAWISDIQLNFPTFSLNIRYSAWISDILLDYPISCLYFRYPAWLSDILLEFPIFCLFFRYPAWLSYILLEFPISCLIFRYSAYSSDILLIPPTFSLFFRHSACFSEVILALPKHPYSRFKIPYLLGKSKKNWHLTAPVLLNYIKPIFIYLSLLRNQHR